MRKPYNIRSGIIFSLFIGVIANIPRLIRQDIRQFVFHSALLFLCTLTCWFTH